MNTLMKLLKVTDPLQLKAALIKLAVKIGIVLVYSVVLFVKGCQYGEDRQVKDFNKDQEKAQETADKLTNERVGEVVKTEKAGQRKAARLEEIRGRTNEAISDNADCTISNDELLLFNELAQEASR